MPKKKANESRFYFFCGSLPSETFEVMNFTGTDRISSPYQFTLMLLSKQADIRAEDVVNKQSTLFMYRDEEYYPYSGIVSEFQFVDRNVDYATYMVKLVPKLWLLNLNVQTRVFQKKNVPTIVKEVLDEAGLNNYYSMDVNDGSYPEHEYVVQYQESDLNFISRLMEENGIWYFFNETPFVDEEIEGTPENEALEITDKAARFEFIPQSDILYRAVSGLTEREDEEDKESINSLRQSRQVIPKEVLLKNFNYRTPESAVSSTRQIKEGDAGSVYEYGGLYDDSSESDRLAQVAAGRIACRQIMFDGSGNCPAFRAGRRYELAEHFRDDFNAPYVVTQVLHNGAHTLTNDSAHLSTYTNTFTCIPSSLADIFRPERKAVVPRINGVMTALIEAEGSDYAAIDEQGRYKVRMPFDNSGSGNYKGSKFMRLAQAYSGANYGMHFPSHEGSEMIFGCIDGDPSRPLGLGTVPNANTISPVTSSNKEQSVLRTAGNNEMVMDDTDGKQKIRFTTNGKHTAEMDDENKRMYLQTTDGNQLLMDDKEKKCSWNGEDHNITMDYGGKKIVISSAGGHVVSIDDGGKKITIQSNGGNVIEMDDNSKKITMSDGNGKGTVELDGNKGITLDTMGKITLNATQDVEIKGMNIKMSANSALEGKATGDVKLSGMNVNAKANMNFAAEGNMNADMKGSLGASVSGGTGKVECAVTGVKASGPMAELAGQGMTTVKGGVVMIN